jgi:DNA repair protein RecO (recombination protein O)
MITDFYAIREDIKSYSLACYLCECASSFAVSGEDSSAILRLLLNSLYALENEKASRALIKSAFELRLCAESGFMPEVSFCTDCESELSGKSFLFHIYEGMSFCTDCASSGNEYLLLTPAVGKAITHITESEMAKFISFRIGESDQKLLSECAERFMLSRAERGFKTLSFYKHCEELP